MPGNEIEQLLQSVRANDPELRTIMIGSEFFEFGGEGALLLAEALRHNTHAQELIISNSKLGDNGIIALLDALDGNETLKTLQFDREQLNHNSASALISMLASNNSLEALLLTNNQIPEETMVQLPEVLATNTSLKHIDLDGTPHSPQCAELWIETLKSNRRLCSLNIQKTPGIEQHNMIETYCYINSQLDSIEAKLLSLTPDVIESTDQSTLDLEMDFIDFSLQALIIEDDYLGTNYHDEIETHIERKKEEIRLLKPEFSLQRSLSLAPAKIARGLFGLFASKPSNTLSDRSGDRPQP